MLLSVFVGLDAGKDRAWERPGIRAIKGDEDLLRAPLVRVLPPAKLLVFHSMAISSHPSGDILGVLCSHECVLCCHQVAGVVTSCKPNGLGDLFLILKVSTQHVI
jgi:hypothetical protein